MWSLYRLYLNMVLKRLLRDGNDIIVENLIVEALSFQGGLVGGDVVVLGCSNLTENALQNF